MKAGDAQVPVGVAAIAVLFLMVVSALAPALFSTHPLVPCRSDSDVHNMFRPSRAFAARELREGRLPLWNPHIYGGQSYVGTIQSALFYPPTWLHVVLPPRWAFNAFFGLHLLLAAGLMFGWARWRGLSPLAAMVAAVIFTFSGAMYLRVQAGHVTMLAAAAWMPLVMWSIDQLMRRPRVKWMFIGAAATAMMLLAGHPQTVYYAALAAAMYVLLNVRRMRRPGRSLGALVMMVGVAGLIGAAAVLPGLETAALSIRTGGWDMAAANTFSLAPENVLTLVCPGLFGDNTNLPYWGQWYFWEGCVFVGVLGLLLAVVGATCGLRRHRRGAMAVAVVLMVLALGASTPIYGWLWQWLPGFGKFRGAAKLALPATMFLAFLAGAGVHRVMLAPLSRRAWVTIAGLTLIATVLAIAGAALAESWIPMVMTNATQSHTAAMPEQFYANADFIAAAMRHGAKALIVVAAWMVAFTVVIVFSQRWRNLAPMLAVLAMVELMLFAYHQTPATSIVDDRPTTLANFMKHLPADARVLNVKRENAAMLFGDLDVWGYDPLVSRRYAQLIAATQGVGPDAATYTIRSARPHPLLAMLRCHAVIAAYANEPVHAAPVDAPLPRALLVDEYEVVEPRDARLQKLIAPDFDPRQRVLLEREPVITPTQGATGTVRVVDQSTDHLSLQVQTSGATLLLLTDAYDPGWRVEALSGSSQQRYELLPANHALRAIPLQAGEHNLRLVYEPRMWRLGCALSAIGVAVWLSLGVLQLRRGQR